MDNLNALFQTAREATVQPGFEETKNLFLQSLHVQQQKTLTKKASIHFKKYLIMFSIITTLVFGITIFSIGDTKNENANVAIVKALSSDSIVKNEKSETTRSQSPSSQVHLESPLPTQNVDLPSFVGESKPKKQLTENQLQVMAQIDSNFSLVQPDLFVPKLTPEDIKENNKRKKRMVKDLLKLDKDEYAYSPSGSFQYKGKPVSVQGFFISSKEVSVIQYKTFLWDLVIQGRISDFHKAKPDFMQWVTIGGKDLQYMVDHYFSDPLFENHPINNISREGAEMYCIWLTQETNKERKEPMNDLRLPSRIEWVYAASANGEHKTYPWTGDSITNASGCPLANFNYADYPQKDSLQCTFCKDCTATKTARSTAQFMSLEQLGPHQYTSFVNSFRPNGKVLYNMAGNVAEMVYENNESTNAPGLYTVDKTRIGTAGGGWMDLPEVLRLDGPDPYQGVNGAHPNIGFRMVFTVLIKN